MRYTSEDVDEKKRCIDCFFVKFCSNDHAETVEFCKYTYGGN